MSLQKLTKLYLPAIENELRQVVDSASGTHFAGLSEMMTYHMGWEGQGAGAKARGKRVRPMLVLLTTVAAGGKWQQALPAAAAVELVHNFSLIHDDIEDNSSLRRGRPTVWKKWGLAQAINTGDAMFSLAHLALLRLDETLSPRIILEAAVILQQTCLHLTQGQYLDISYENRSNLSVADYWPMVRGKTAALLTTCTELGALIAESNYETRATYRRFGFNLGLAFQALDDYLGIWGNAAQTGKSVASDLLEGKKSLPVLYGLEQDGDFATRWAKGPIPPGEVSKISAQLEAEGARTYTHNEARRMTQQALQALEDAGPRGDAGEALFELTNKLMQREI
ncbi:MAG: polyprenyl synthetase family protein [Chloroflexota bacterium]|nr:polyprenyl synthetase family protein [Chloroflexota bacterium]